MTQNIRYHNVGLACHSRTKQLFQIFFLRVEKDKFFEQIKNPMEDALRIWEKLMDDFTLYILNLTFLFELSVSSSSNATSAPSPWHIAFAQFNASMLAERMQSTRP